jgi:serine/threonine protein kinase
MHRLGFAHLDVKLDNILSNGVNTYKLVDYGLTARLDGPPDFEEGDRRYLAPELLASKCTHPAAADIFSLGISMYQLVSGTSLPSDGPDYTMLREGIAPRCPDASDLLSNTLEVRLALFHITDTALLLCKRVAFDCKQSFHAVPSSSIGYVADHDASRSGTAPQQQPDSVLVPAASGTAHF